MFAEESDILKYIATLGVVLCVGMFVIVTSGCAPNRIDLVDSELLSIEKHAENKNLK